MAVYETRAEIEKLKKRILELTSENEAYKACITEYEKDFEIERKDRIKAVAERFNIEEELKTYKKPNQGQPKSPQRDATVRNNEIEHLKNENDHMKLEISRLNNLLSSKQKELDAVKANLEAMEDIIPKQLKALNVQLAEAKEEIAVKVAQVKQYQKQVEAYKGQASQLQDVTTSEPKHPDHTYPSLRGQAESACDGCDNQMNPPSAACQIAASMPDGDGKKDDSDDDLPPPIFHKPFQPMYHPDVAHGMQNEDIPLSQLEASEPSALPNRVGHARGIPPFSIATIPQSIDLAAGIDDEISRVAAAVQRETSCAVLEKNK